MAKHGHKGAMGTWVDGTVNPYRRQFALMHELREAMDPRLVPSRVRQFTPAEIAELNWWHRVQEK